MTRVGLWLIDLIDRLVDRLLCDYPNHPKEWL